MDIKLFGKSLFSFNSNNPYVVQAYNQLKETKFLPDFKDFDDVILPNNIISSTYRDVLKIDSIDLQKKENKDITPKDVYELKLLNDDSLKINIDKNYIDEQINIFKIKLNIIRSEEYDMQRGVDQIASVLIRLENRKKYSETKKFFDEFPYTTNKKIKDMLDEHNNLRNGKIAQFIADLPKEAVDVMKRYTDNTMKLCKKKAVFYIIADKKDFEKTDKRRDPILLAQSPFGHFWQILGAWDKEMMFLDEL